MVNIPATLTASGKRERHFHKTRDLAAAHAQELRSRFLDHGSNAAAITPAMAEDATLAADLLKPWNASLLEARGCIRSRYRGHRRILAVLRRLTRQDD